MHSGVEHVWGLGVKRLVLTLGVLTVDVSADGKMTYQIYVTEET